MTSQPDPGKVVISFTYDIQALSGAKLGDYATSYTIYSTGDVIIKNQFYKISDLRRMDIKPTHDGSP